jgi:hypothetical protein
LRRKANPIKIKKKVQKEIQKGNQEEKKKKDEKIEIKKNKRWPARRPRTEGIGREPCSGRISEDGELATGTGPVQFAVPSGSVVNLGGHLDIILGALSSLVGGGETPRPSTTISVNSKRVVGSGGNNDGVDTGDLSGLDQNARSTMVILDD